MSGDLVERVARAMADADGCEAAYFGDAIRYFRPIARAAVRVVVEECALVAGECHFDEDDPRNDDRDRAYAQARRHAAKDIRALLDNSNGEPK